MDRDPDDVMLERMPLIRPILDQITDKWSLMILIFLCPGPHRFNEIRRSLSGVTQKALTQTLRRLERNGLVERRVLATSPVGVEYRLTTIGRSLSVPFAALYQWTVDNLDEVIRSQKQFDHPTVRPNETT